VLKSQREREANNERSGYEAAVLENEEAEKSTNNFA
jgi:hypothetical protein